MIIKTSVSAKNSSSSNGMVKKNRVLKGSRKVDSGAGQKE